MVHRPIWLDSCLLQAQRIISSNRNDVSCRRRAPVSRALSLLLPPARCDLLASFFKDQLTAAVRGEISSEAWILRCRVA